MYKYIAAIIICMLSAKCLQAQRLIKGQKGFEIGAGLISDRKPIHDYFYLRAAMTINGKNGSYQLWGIEYTYKKHQFEGFNIPVETYSVEGGYSFRLLGDWSKNISLNLGLSGVAGYEVINEGESLLSNGAVIQNKDSFIYGGDLRLSVEAYLSDHIVMLIDGRSKVIWGTSVERLRPSAGLGFRYIF